MNTVPYLFYKNKVQMVILRCWKCLYLHWHKSYNIKHKFMTFSPVENLMHHPLHLYLQVQKWNWILNFYYWHFLITSIFEPFCLVEVSLFINSKMFLLQFINHNKNNMRAINLDIFINDLKPDTPQPKSC
jgi:hypothetical protein